MTTPVAIMNAELNVLIVEDDDRFQRMLVTMLRSLDCSTTAYSSAQHALDWLREHRADVILLDLNMPRMDGLAFLEALRRRGDLTRVIVLTGVGTLRAAQTSIRLGVSDFLTKPCHLGDIESALQRIRRERAGRCDMVRSTCAAADNDPDADDASLSDSSAMHAPQTLAEIEKQAIDAALRHTNGNRTAAAALLGISRRTLHYRLVEYGEQCSGNAADKADSDSPHQAE